MKTNIGVADMWIRLVLGAVACTFYFSGSAGGLTGIILLAAAAVFLLSGTAGSCPFYSLFNISTTRKNKEA